MNRITTSDFSPFFRNSIGTDRLVTRILDQMDNTASGNYPPYNILKTGPETFEVQVAVAGFSEGEIEIKVHDGNLVVTGEKLPTPIRDGVEYVHQGISARKFIRTFTMSEYIEVNGAIVKDGILTIQLERIIPDSAKPKTIAITYSNS